MLTAFIDRITGCCVLRAHTHPAGLLKLQGPIILLASRK